MYSRGILPIISRHYLSHLVTNIEELINEKKKQAFLEHIRNTVVNNKEYVYERLEKMVEQKMLRLFSIILVPVDCGKVKARTYFFKGEYSVQITYWNRLPYDQIRLLIAHELGHVANKYLFGNSASDDGLATLLGYIALQDRNNFYKNTTKQFTRVSDLQIYHDIINVKK
jgi:hypothetical protein